MATLNIVGQSLPKSMTLEQLRVQAQANLASIEAEKEQEKIEQQRRAKEAEIYVRTKGRTGSRSPTAAQEAKAPTLRTAEDVLDRLRHDPSLNILEYVIGYLERFEGVKEMKAESWLAETTDEEFIPLHRIKYFKRKESDGSLCTVWHRVERIDRIFGSGLGNGAQVV